MALSGSFSGSILSGKYKLRVDWSATQNVGSNTSKVTCAFYLVQASSWSLNISSRTDNEATINGTKQTWTSVAVSNGGGKTTKLGSVTSGNITHNADGTKSITISAKFNIEATISGTYYSAITASATVTLNTIPRATAPTLSASSVNMGSAVTINLPRASSAFTHNLAYSFEGGTYTTIDTDVGASYSWTVPDKASSIPNATSGKMTVRCITYSGGKSIGTKYAYLTAKVPTSVVPTVSSVAVAEATAGLAAQFGVYVQNKSKLSVNVTGAGVKGSTITGYSTTVLGKTYTTKTFTTGEVTTTGTVTVSAKVKDSRGRWSAAKTTNVTVVAYSKPKVQKLHAYRVNSAGAADEQGEYLALDCQYSVAPVSNKNTASAVIEYRPYGSTSWEEILTSTALSVNETVKPTGMTFSVDRQFDVCITVTDWFGAVASYTATLPSAEVLMDFLANGKGIAFGQVAQAEGVAFGWPIVGAVKSTGSQKGVYRTHDGLLVQWGTVSITPTEANAATTQVVTYSRPFTADPVVMLTPNTSVPENVSVGIIRTASVIGDAKEAIGVVMTRNGTTTTVIQWLAIGPG